MLIYQENYLSAKKEYERRKSVGTKCAEKATQIQSKIVNLKLTSITSVSKLIALDLRKQTLIVKNFITHSPIFITHIHL